MMTNVAINEMNLKIKDAIYEQKTLQELFVNTKLTLNNISVTDSMQISVNNMKMRRSLNKAKITNKEIEISTS